MTRRMATVLLLCLLSSAVLVVTPTTALGGGCFAEGDEISSSRAEGDATVLMEKCQFVTPVVFIEPGSTVTWTNNDPVPHSVTGAFRSIGGEKLLNDGDELSFRFDNAGVFPYYCVLHAGMAGAVVVGDVDELKAAAPLDANAVAVPPVDEAAPPGDANESREETSSNAAPIAIGAGVVALIIAAAIAVMRRKPVLQP